MEMTEEKIRYYTNRVEKGKMSKIMKGDSKEEWENNKRFSSEYLQGR